MSDETPALIAFLRARLDEEERVSRAATPGPWTIDESGDFGDKSAVMAVARWRGYVNVVNFGEDFETARHIVCHDPARVLAEVTAKRQMISLVESAASRLGVYEEQTIGWDFLIAMAQIWRDHPDNRPDGEWYEHESEWR